MPCPLHIRLFVSVYTSQLYTLSNFPFFSHSSNYYRHYIKNTTPPPCPISDLHIISIHIFNMETATSSPIFSPLDAADLELSGLLGPVEETGQRKCHKRRLHSWGDIFYKEIPLDIVMGSPEAAAAKAFVTIPSALISRATLCYLGFSELKVDEMWNEWSNWPGREIDINTGDLQGTFLAFILGHVKKENAYTDDDSEWRRCLDECGVSPSEQDKLMDPDFKEIRLSRSCVYWVTDTIEMRYAGLQDFQRASRQRELQLERERL